MASIEDLLSQLPMGKIAQMLGVDEPTAAQATKTAVPALVQGMQANAADPARAAALAKAIAAHAKKAAPAPADVDAVDTADGDKIVSHVFGANTDQVTNLLGGTGGAGGDVFKKLLPMLAPLVMGFLAKSFVGGKQAVGSGQAAAASAASSGGGLVGMLKDKLGGLFGGKKATTTSSASGVTHPDDSSGGLGDLLGGGGLGDMLGGLLGGGGGGAGSDGGGGGIGDVLGGLLGGGSK